ncbi:homoserine kinase [Metabacillus iocasae]|uniref:Homoserine kinase n=1 Tax=Priestia iocasae TaxID=2291674 RepID=A0ABS2QYN1_9BACI|nr:homoserine kinase [Metabacillus iocasae]MBM7704605.1 homoserine kinase [Metabacillus iocasae]
MLGSERAIIKVPASSANIGPGFDSIGMALSRYLTLKIELADEWVFIPQSEEVESIPTGKDNLMYEVALEVATSYKVNLPAAKVYVSSDIPLARGLGSSASAIVAGIELASLLCQLNLSIDEKLRIASVMEGHPDNVSPSLYGGIVVGYHHKDDTYITQVPYADVDVVMVIPKYELKTTDARDVLPKQLSYQEAVEAGAVGNMLVAALMKGNWPLVGTLMEKDLYHEPYRMSLVAELPIVREEAKKIGAYGVALSGAGPSILCLARKGDGERIVNSLRKIVPHCEVDVLTIDHRGVQVHKEAITTCN